MPRWHIGFELFLLVINVSGISLLLLQLSTSNNMTKTSMPMFLDVLLNSVEIFLVVMSHTFKRFIDEIVGEVENSYRLPSVDDFF